jgi:hypothetical protein
VGSVVHEVTLGQVLVIIPPMPRTHSFTYHRRYAILPTERIVMQHTCKHTTQSHTLTILKKKVTFVNSKIYVRRQ